MIGYDWSGLNLAGAFIVGAVIGSIATIRVVRAVSSTLRDERRKDRDG